MARSVRVFAIAAMLVVAVTASGTASAVTPNGPSGGAAADTYQNPVSLPDVENFGSPTLIRGHDGFWYAFGPGNPLNHGEERPLFPIMRSPDLTSWSYVGDVFTPDTFPTWAKEDSNMWAPSIEYVNGRYHLYFTLRNIAGYEQTPNTAIGVATAPTPTGPWTDSGRPLVTPKTWQPPDAPPRYRTIIDADALITPYGDRYLYYGGFGGGVYGIRLSGDGMSTVGEERRLTAAQIYEGPYVVHRDGWYYMFVSSGHCCKGPVTGYAVQVGRSRDPMGPFVDAEGIPLAADSPGGTQVLTANGNTFVGTGHNAAVTDLAGQQWLTFNGIDRTHPYLGEPLRENRRPLLLDRLDWIDGWPTVRGGAGATDGPTAAPAATGWLVDAFEEGDQPGDSWRPSHHWRIEREPAGGYLATGVPDGERMLDSATAVAGDARVRAAVRLGDGTTGAAGFALAHHGDSDAARVLIDRDADALVIDVTKDGDRVARTTAPLPPSFSYRSWHDLDVTVRGRTVVAEVTSAGLFDPVATVEATLPTGLEAGPVALLARDTAADVDDVTAARLHTPETTRAPTPVAGPLDPGASDEFDNGLGTGWSWVRDPVATAAGGALTFPVHAADLSGQRNDASLLLRDAPSGDWIAETRVRMPLGDAEPPAFPQAGLLVYASDDHYLRLSSMGHGALRETAYQKEMPYAGSLVNNAGYAGAAGEVTWLRLHHRIDPVDGEHEVRAGTSRDGTNWTWAAVLTLPADADLRIGIGAHGAGPDDEFTATFDYFRVYRG